MVVQIIAIVLLAILISYSLYDYKKALLIWLPFKLLFNDQIAVKYTSPGISLVIAGDLALIAIFFIKNNKSHEYTQTPFLFKIPAIVFGVSYLISTVFSIAPLQSSVIATVKYFASGFCMLYLAHKCFRKLSDIEFFVKCCLIVAILIAILAFWENVIKTNPWLDFVYYNSPMDTGTNRMYYTPGSMELRYGLIKSRSFFSYHIPFGFACLCLFWVLFFFSKKIKTHNKKYLMIVSYLLVVCAIMSLSKQIYLGLFFIIIGFYSFKKLSSLTNIIPILLILFVVLIYAPEYINNISGLFDDKVAEEGGGSTVAARSFQYKIMFEMFKLNPLVGSGIASLDTLRSHGNFAFILGAESCWLLILPERGILGAIAYVFLYIHIWRYNKYIDRKLLFFYLFSIFIIENAGGIKDISVWGTMLLAVYRYNEIIFNNRSKLLKIREWKKVKML